MPSPTDKMLLTPDAHEACSAICDPKAGRVGVGVYDFVVLGLPATAEPPLQYLASGPGRLDDVCATLDDPATCRFVLLRAGHAILLVQFLGAQVGGVRRARSIAQARTLARDLAPFRQAASTVMITQPSQLTPQVVQSSVQAKTKRTPAAPGTSSLNPSAEQAASGQPANLGSGGTASGRAGPTTGIAALRARYAALDTAAAAVSTSVKPARKSEPALALTSTSLTSSTVLQPGDSNQQTTNPGSSESIHEQPQPAPTPQPPVPRAFPMRSVSASASVPTYQPSRSSPLSSTAAPTSPPVVPTAPTTTQPVQPAAMVATRSGSSGTQASSSQAVSRNGSRSTTSSVGDSSRRTASSISTATSPISAGTSSPILQATSHAAPHPHRSPYSGTTPRPSIDSYTSLDNPARFDPTNEEEEQVPDHPDDPVLHALRYDRSAYERVLVARARLLRSQQAAASDVSKAKAEQDRYRLQLDDAQTKLYSMRVRADVLAERWVEQRTQRVKLDAFDRSQVEASEQERNLHRSQQLASQTRMVNQLHNEVQVWFARAQELREQAGKRMRAHTAWEQSVVEQVVADQQTKAAQAERQGLKHWAQLQAQHWVNEADQPLVLPSAQSALGTGLSSTTFLNDNPTLLVACVGIQRGEAGYIKRRTCVVRRAGGVEKSIALDVYSSDPAVIFAHHGSPMKSPLWSVSAHEIRAIYEADSELMLDHAIALLSAEGHMVLVLVADTEQEKVTIAAAVAAATGAPLSIS